MTVAPAVRAVTRPAVETVATVALDDVQLTTRPVNALPWASLGVAVNVAVSPTFSVVTGDAIATDATGAGAVGPSPPQARLSPSRNGAMRFMACGAWEAINIVGGGSSGQPTEYAAPSHWRGPRSYFPPYVPATNFARRPSEERVRPPVYA